MQSVKRNYFKTTIFRCLVFYKIRFICFFENFIENFNIERTFSTLQVQDVLRFKHIAVFFLQREELCGVLSATFGEETKGAEHHTG